MAGKPLAKIGGRRIAFDEAKVAHSFLKGPEILELLNVNLRGIYLRR